MDTSIDIPVPTIFDFKTNLDFLNRDPNECMHKIDKNSLIKFIEVDGIRTLIKITAAENKHLRITFIAGSRLESAREKQAITDYVWDMFDLHKELEPFYVLAKTDPLLSRAVERFYGLRIIQIPDLFEALCWGILGQQINLAYAYTLKRQFVEAFGESLTVNGKTYWLFPTYDKIAKITPGDLSNIKMTVRKSEYMIDIAKMMNAGELSKKGLLKLGTPSEMEKALVKIRGIGPWTANYLLMRCFGFTTAFPIDDIGLINAIKQQLGMDAKPTKAEIMELANNWTGWEAYATFYLWRTLY